LGEVLVAVEEGSNRDVPGNMIEGENQVLFRMFIKFSLKLRWDKPVIELAANGFDGV
jgi:hypothetical protein